MTHSKETNFETEAFTYINNLSGCFNKDIFSKIEKLAWCLLDAWETGKNVYICGNGGSAGNAIHIANDFHYGIGACGKEPFIPGIKVEALPSNQAIISCLANDTGFENIFKHQLQVKANKGDILIALSGSGNSENIISAIKYSHEIGMQSYLITAFDGGRGKNVAENVIHIPVHDMQIAEDSQLIIGHICMQWLNSKKPKMSRTLK